MYLRKLKRGIKNEFFERTYRVIKYCMSMGYDTKVKEARSSKELWKMLIIDVQGENAQSENH
jgi:hypothetical protein